MFGKTYQNIINPVTVTFRKKTGEGLYLDYTVQYVLVRASMESLVRDGELEVVTTVRPFHLWKDNLQGQTPVEGDQVVYEGTSYALVEVKTEDRGERFRCLGRELA